MKSLIIYDSFFGNTQKIAEAIQQGFDNEVSIFKIGDITKGDLENINLLIIGSPTRAFRPSKPISDFVQGLSKDSLNNVKVAVFDTRISAKDTNSKVLSLMVKTFGYAAENIAKKLKSKGFEVIAVEGFFVKDTEGPLKDGELERATAWAKELSK